MSETNVREITMRALREFFDRQLAEVDVKLAEIRDLQRRRKLWDLPQINPSQTKDVVN